jgi:hypothetical protein
VLKTAYADPTNKLTSVALRWAYGTPPFVELARQRVAGVTSLAA